MRGGDGRCGDVRFISVDREHGLREAAAQGLDDGQQAAELIGGRDRCGARAGGLRAEVEHVGTFVQQGLGPAEGVVDSRQHAAIGE
jgi:hypothetical protein